MQATNGSPSNTLHPYYPTGVEIEAYVPNRDPIFTSFVFFTTGLVAILGTTLEISSFIRPSMAKADRFALLWFVLCKHPISSPARSSVFTGKNSGEPPLYIRGIFCHALRTCGRRSRYPWTDLERVRSV
jgi:hypothetical protein